MWFLEMWLFLSLLLRRICGHDKSHYGMYSGHISDFEVVVPKRVSTDGTELHDHATILRNHTIGKREVLANKKIHLKLTIAGKEEILDLWLSTEFITRGLVVQRLGKKHEKVANTPTTEYQNGCHYRGTIRGKPNSVVAISTCRGTVGFIKTDSGDYWIEPSSENGSSKRGSKERLHLLFRRTTAVGQRFSKRKRKKKRRKHDKLCGTREPRRIMESHLEWNQKPGWVRVQGRGKRRGYHHDGEHHHKRRFRRSVSKKRHVECLVVADTSMVEFYQGEDVETYLLTIMNMVSVMYQDPSIGNYVSVVVVRIILLEDDSLQGLNVTVNADRTLDNFCRWQMSLNRAGEQDPSHHDVAILITRQDICAGADKPCSTLGVAHVAGMCLPDRSCSVNEDNGITLAHTVAHELGHNFGMYHDSAKSGCSGREGSTLHVMTPSFEADTLHIAWSSCSRRDITHFFDGGLGRCLEDEPNDVTPLTYPELPVGAMYNAEYQCKLQFAAEDTSVCIPMDEICSRLWCIVDGVCTTMLHPAAPGTSCGKHKWCQQQSCVGMGERLEAVDGGWGHWSEWKPCSRTCGVGVTTQERLCDHPVPSNGGKYCLGERMRYRICNAQDCPEASVSFRAEQCSSFNNKVFHADKNISWFPYFETSEPCQLYCTDEEDSIIMPMGVQVLDSTPCNLGTYDMCIDGLCRKVGCDLVVDSDAEDDRCGVCRGDGKLCTTVEGYYNKTHGSGYVELVTVPKNARNIIVEELGNSKNYIGVGSASNNRYYLNGNKAITLPGEYVIADSEALYRRQKDKERLHILGPIREEILIFLIYQGGYKNLGLRFEYTLPLKNKEGNKHYWWELSDWAACSVTCGKGEQRSAPVCREKSGDTVDDSFCPQEKKPETAVRACSLHPCAHRWWTGPWQLCPVTCGDLAMRKRTVLCVSNNDHQIALPDTECADRPRPDNQEPCVNTPPCLFSMYTDSPSSPIVSPNGKREPHNHHRNKKKRLHFKSGGGANSLDRLRGRWKALPWSQCSKTCGLGFKRRTVYCTKPEHCELKLKPIELKQCYRKCP